METLEERNGSSDHDISPHRLMLKLKELTSLFKKQQKILEHYKHLVLQARNRDSSTGTSGTSETLINNYQEKLPINDHSNNKIRSILNSVSSNLKCNDAVRATFSNMRTVDSRSSEEHKFCSDLELELEKLKEINGNLVNDNKTLRSELDVLRKRWNEAKEKYGTKIEKLKTLLNASNFVRDEKCQIVTRNCCNQEESRCMPSPSTDCPLQSGHFKDRIRVNFSEMFDSKNVDQPSTSVLNPCQAPLKSYKRKRSYGSSATTCSAHSSSSNKENDFNLLNRVPDVEPCNEKKGKSTTKCSKLAAVKRMTFEEVVKCRLKGLVVVLSGEFKNLEFLGEPLLNKQGVKDVLLKYLSVKRVTNSISGVSDALIVGDILQDGRPGTCGNKYIEAQSFGIPVLRESDIAIIFKDIEGEISRKLDTEQRAKLIRDCIAQKESTQQAPACVQTTRNKLERANLPAHTCLECQKFYNALDTNMFTEQQKLELVTECSRHRFRDQDLPPSTPPHYWSLPTLSTPSRTHRPQKR